MAANEWKRRVLCVVMDGVGERAERFGNAVAVAETPTMDRLRKEALYTTLKAHGTAVGLPSDSDIGNSEVGHNAIGAGRIFAQGAKLVNVAMEDGSLFEGETWKDLISTVKKRDGALHFLGLLSDGNVHSNEQHLYTMLRRAKDEGVSRARVHVLFDGRDVGEKSAETYVERLEKTMAELRSEDFDVKVASGGGRMTITMDRYGADWGMVQKGWETHVHANAPLKFPSLAAAVEEFRKDPKMTDQHFPPFVITEDGEPTGPMQDGDGAILYNFRGDRAIEISRAFTEPDFNEFDRGRVPDVYFAGMMEYDGDLHVPDKFLVEPPVIEGGLSEYLLGHGARQFACSETQKFGHVTYFWNGNKSGYLDPEREEYVEIPSASVPFQDKPEMKAPEITDTAIDRMRRGTFDFGRINFANGDMVGHTGFFEAVVKGMEAVDRQLARLVEVAEETGTTLLITADHGNCDEMFDGNEADYPDWDKPGGKRPSPKTAHTRSPVPLFLYEPGGAKGLKFTTEEPRTLAHIAGTVVDLMGLPPNDRYLPSLLIHG